MDGLFKRATAWEIVKLLGPFVLSGLIGGWLIWYGHRNGYEFTKALGDGFLIAGIIGLALELSAASEIIRHTTNELSARLVGYGLPKAGQELIHRLVHETKRVYRDYRKSFRIVRHPEKAGYVIVHCVVSYRVVNNGKGRERYRPALQEEGMYLPTVATLQYRQYSLQSAELTTETWPNGVRNFEPKERVWISSSDATAAIETLKEDQVCNVRWAYQIEMPEYYCDVTAFAGMTINPVLELTEKPDDFEFLASEESTCKHVGQTWSYDCAFVAGQHVRVWWRPRA